MLSDETLDRLAADDLDVLPMTDLDSLIQTAKAHAELRRLVVALGLPVIADDSQHAPYCIHCHADAVNYRGDGIVHTMDCPGVLIAAFLARGGGVDAT